MRFWISFYVPDPGGETWPSWPDWPGTVWISGETGGIGDHPPQLTVCGVLDADDEASAIAAGRAALGNADSLRFCDSKPDGWMPNADRFKP
jgi:hypothetical protein